MATHLLGDFAEVDSDVHGRVANADDNNGFVSVVQRVLVGMCVNHSSLERLLSRPRWRNERDGVVSGGMNDSIENFVDAVAVSRKLVLSDERHGI